MEPFITRFAKSHLVTTRNRRANHKQNANTDCSLIVNTHKLAIDDAGAFLQSIGTIRTTAQSDPTRDEPTDR